MNVAERHMPVVKSFRSCHWHPGGGFTPGMCCSAQTLFCNGQHQRRLDNRTLETNPHTLAFSLHGGCNGYLHGWKVCSTGSGCDYGCSCCSDVVCRRIHRCESPGKHQASLPPVGRRQAACGHDQHPSGKAHFHTSHAGTGISFALHKLGRSMGAPDLSHPNDCALTPARAAGRRERMIWSRRS